MLRSIKHKTNLSKNQLSLFVLAFALVGAIVLYLSLAAPNPNLPGDLNNDNTVNISDLSILLTNYGSSNSTADINGDGTVNVLDMSILLSHYGQSYNLPTGSFTGTYFNNTTLSGTPVLTRNDAYPLNFDWGNGSPDPSINTDGFSARWDGNFSFNAGSYTFTATVDDGVRLYIDNNLVMDHWINEAATTYTYTQTMTSGTHYIRMEYYDFTNAAVAKLSWSTGSGGGGGSAWVPAPPSSTSATGTFSTIAAVDIDNGGTRGTPDFALFHPQREHAVEVQHGGIFFAYNYIDSDHNPAYWRLKRSISTDASGNYDGNSWTTVYTESTYNTGGGAPAVESDANGNVYVVVSQYGDSTQNYFKVFKFGPTDNYTTPTIFSYSNFGAANKWGCNFDQTRNWIWIQAWQRSTPGELDLLAIDQSGAVKVSKQILTPWSSVSSTANADAEYPFVEVTHDGTIIIAWNNDAGDGIRISPQSYYDVRVIYSPDAGSTWYGQGGAIPGLIYPDDTGPSNQRGYDIVDLTPGVEFIPATDPNYYPNGTAMYNFNAVGGIAYNQGALHLYYGAFTSGNIVGPAHRSYARFNWSTKSVDKRVNPFFTSDTHISNLTGNFCQDTTQNDRLYFIGVGGDGDYGKIVVYKSDDGGSSWSTYAKSAVIGGLPNYAGCDRFVQSDGSILAYAAQYSSPNNIYFFRITPN